MAKRVRGEVKISVEGNPFSYNPENVWNFGARTEIVNVNWDVTQLLEILKKLQGKQ